MTLQKSDHIRENPSSFVSSERNDEGEMIVRGKKKRSPFCGFLACLLPKKYQRQWSLLLLF